jgi:anti-sigma regulatory factor (Ser/Thr protein kinase)
MRLGEEMVALHLPATVGSARLARETVEDVLELEPYEDLQFVTALLTTELVANAVRHAGLAPDDDFALLAESEDGSIHVEVADGGPGFFPLPHARSEPGHRIEHGLHLVDVLADRWGYRCDRPGCRVWFEIDLVPGRRPWRGREPIARDRAAKTP